MCAPVGRAAGVLELCGRWWVVGSAWAGRGGERGGGGRAEEEGRRAKTSGGGGAEAHERLLKLAAAQRMNTKLRRSIFVSIMGADDYLDAHVTT